MPRDTRRGTVGEEQAAEEKHLGDEEQPHPERRRFVLLLQRVEVMLEIGMMAVRMTAGRNRCRVRQL